MCLCPSQQQFPLGPANIPQFTEANVSVSLSPRGCTHSSKWPWRTTPILASRDTPECPGLVSQLIIYSCKDLVPASANRPRSSLPCTGYCKSSWHRTSTLLLVLISFMPALHKLKSERREPHGENPSMRSDCRQDLQHFLNQSLMGEGQDDCECSQLLASGFGVL